MPRKPFGCRPEGLRAQAAAASFRKLGPVHQAHELATGFAVALVLHRHTGDQQPVEPAIGSQQHRRAEVDHLADGIVTGGGRNAGVEGRDGLAQALDQQNLPVVVALGSRPIGCQVGPMAVLPAHVGQPAQAFLFERIATTA